MAKTSIVKGVSPDRVSYVEPGFVKVSCSDHVLEEQLRKAGFKRRWRAMFQMARIGVSTEKEMADCLGFLRDLGIPFELHSGWSPASVFMHLRGQGLLGGQFCCILKIEEIKRGGPGWVWEIRDDQ